MKEAATDLTALLKMSRSQARKRKQQPRLKPKPVITTLAEEVPTTGHVKLRRVTNSSIVFALGYDPGTKTLGVAYVNKSIYHYPDWTLRAYKKLLKEKSIGSALRKMNLTRYTRIM